MSQMAARVSDAIFDQLGAAGVVIDGDCDWLTVAAAAIRAMREPTQEMIDAADGCDDCMTGYVQGADNLTHWHAMIDAALGEGEAASEGDEE
jgi:hypothetical protein